MKLLNIFKDYLSEPKSLLNFLNEMNFGANSKENDNKIKSKSVNDFKTQIKKQVFSMSSSDLEGNLAQLNLIENNDTEFTNNDKSKLATDEESFENVIMKTKDYDKDCEKVSSEV